VGILPAGFGIPPKPSDVAGGDVRVTSLVVHHVGSIWPEKALK
jgi:hypothetical protein